MSYKNILNNEIKHAILHNNHIEEKEIWDDYLKSKSKRKRSRSISEKNDVSSLIAKHMDKREREIRRHYKIENELRILEKKKNQNKAAELFDWIGLGDRWTHDLYENTSQRKQPETVNYIDNDSPIENSIQPVKLDSESSSGSCQIISHHKNVNNSSSKSSKKFKKSKKKSKKHKKSKSKSPERKKKKSHKRESSDVIWVERD